MLVAARFADPVSALALQSTAYQLLAARIEELLLAQIALASREESIGQLTSSVRAVV